MSFFASFRRMPRKSTMVPAGSKLPVSDSRFFETTSLMGATQISPKLWSVELIHPTAVPVPSRE